MNKDLNNGVNTIGLELFDELETEYSIFDNLEVIKKQLYITEAIERRYKEEQKYNDFMGEW